MDCGSCRSSGLECDRLQPCISCRNKGMPLLCQAGGSDLAQSPLEDRATYWRTRFQNVKQFLDLVEQGLRPGGAQLNAQTTSSSISYLGNSTDPTSSPPASSPGGEAGARSATTETLFKSRNLNVVGDTAGSPTSAESFPPSLGLHSRVSGRSNSTVAVCSCDKDLLDLLPNAETIDVFIIRHFQSCCWFCQYVDETSLIASWSIFKTSGVMDYILFATICLIISLTLLSGLPPEDNICDLPLDTLAEVGWAYYNVMCIALDRAKLAEQTDAYRYTLHFVELLLLRMHYLTSLQYLPEQAWAIRGEVLAIATAMGLHRDSSDIIHSPATTERRRWAWWNIVFAERLQAHLFCRPYQISSHHFNVALPSIAEDSTGTADLRHPSLALFRLVPILGAVVDVTLRISSSQLEDVCRVDYLLTQWYTTIPSHLRQSGLPLARELRSSDPFSRRTALQGVLLRCIYYQIRIALHSIHNDESKNLDIAAQCASDIIRLLEETFASLACPTTVYWAPHFIFYASKFVSSQLVKDPDQLGASLFRHEIDCATMLLQRFNASPVAARALSLLRNLQPLHHVGFVDLSQQQRDETKRFVLQNERRLRSSDEIHLLDPTEFTI